jgi:hypothetical protein
MKARDLEVGKTYVYNRTRGHWAQGWHWINGFDAAEPCTATRTRAKHLWTKGLRDTHLESGVLLRHIGDCAFASTVWGAAHFRILTGDYAGRIVAINGCYGIEPAPNGARHLARHQRPGYLRANIEDWKVQIEKLEHQIEAYNEMIDEAETEAQKIQSYASDEEALASLLSKVLQSDGTEDAILDLLKAHTDTAKL